MSSVQVLGAAGLFVVVCVIIAMFSDNRSPKRKPKDEIRP